MRAALFVLLLTACAQDRYLSAEQDAEMREHCGEIGCAVIRNDQWKILEKLLRGLVI